MKLEAQYLCGHHDNLFVKLHDSTVQHLYNDAILQQQKLRKRSGHVNEIGNRRKSTSTRNTGWNIFLEHPRDIQFLPLQLDCVGQTKELRKTIYTSFNGGYCATEGYIQIPYTLCPLQLTHFHVQVIDDVYDATSIHVEPISTSDWELSEIYAQKLEDGTILNQISIVYPEQIVSLTIGRNTIRLRVLTKSFTRTIEKSSMSGGDGGGDSGNNYKCLRLVANTEVIIAPKPRNKTFQYSRPIRIIPCEDDFSSDMKKFHSKICNVEEQSCTTTINLIPCPPPLTVWMNEDTLKNHIPGWDEVKYVNLNSTLGSLTPQSAHVYLRNTQQRETTVLAQLQSSDLIPNDSLVLHPYLRKQLKVIPLFDRIEIVVITDNQMKRKRDAFLNAISRSEVSIHFSPLQLRRSHSTRSKKLWRYPEDCTSKLSESEGRIAIHSSLDESKVFEDTHLRLLQDLLDENDLLSDETILPFPISTGMIALYQINLRKINNHNKQVKLGSKGGKFPSKFIFNIDDLISLPMHFDDVKSDNVLESDEENYTLNLLPISGFSCDFLRDLSLAEQKLEKFSFHPQDDIINNLVIYGDRGCGKTHFSMALSARLRLLRSWSTVYLDCREIQSAKIRIVGILDAITNLFKQALKSQPSIIVLDNLDELIFNCEDNSGIGNNTSHDHRMDNPLLLSQCKLLADHTKYLIQRIKKDNVSLICTCVNDTQLHRSLRSIHTFTTKMNVPNLSGTARFNLFVEQVNFHGLSVKGKELSINGFSKKSEGYLAKDLKLLAARLASELMKTRFKQPQCDIGVGKLLDDVFSGYIPLNHQMLNLEARKSNLRWSDIGGLKRAKEVLSDVILKPIRYRAIYSNLPIKLPRGILLFGPSGCGKSCIVPAIADESGLNLVTCRGPEILGKYIGESEMRVRRLFERAYAAAPSILFLDDFESLVPRRGSDNTGVTDRCVNQFLTFLDGLEDTGPKDKMVYIIAASSRPDRIDPALLRPGRLEKHILIGFPESDSEWNDLILKMSQRWRLKDETKQKMIDGSLLETLKAEYVKYHQYSAADIKGVFDTAYLSCIHSHLERKDKGMLKNHSESKKYPCVGFDQLLEAFTVSRPSASTKHKLLLRDAYAPFLNVSEIPLAALGLDEESLINFNSTPSITSLKTALK